MKLSKKVSIIVPVYNAYNYISKCIDNLINQTIEDIEIILVNDGSVDKSQEIIDKYIKKYPNKIKSYLKENGGPASARNFGIKKATGEYLGFVDSDDYVDLDYFEKLYNKAKKTSSDVAVAPIKYVYNNKTITKHYDNKMFGKSIKENPEILKEVKSFTWNKLYKRELWIINNFEFPNQYYEDNAIIYNVLLKANKIECISDSYYYYNNQNESSITKIINDRRAYDNFKACDSILSFYRNNNAYYNNIKKYIDGVVIGHIRFRIKTYIKANNLKELKEYVEYSNNYLNKNIKHWKRNYNARIDFKDTFMNNVYKIIFKNKLCLNIYLILKKNKGR